MANVQLKDVYIDVDVPRKSNVFLRDTFIEYDDSRKSNVFLRDVSIEYSETRLKNIFLRDISVEYSETRSKNVYLRDVYLDVSPEDIFDCLAPQTPLFDVIQGQQDISVEQGKCDVTLKWNSLTETQVLNGEYLGQSTGGADTFYTHYYPILNNTGDERQGQLYEVTGYDSGVDTTLAQSIQRQDIKITLNSGNPLVGDWLEISEGQDIEFAEVVAVSGLEVTLKHPLTLRDYSTAATVKKVTVSLKTEGTDYSVNRTTGKIDISNGAITAGNKVFFRYACELQDFSKLEIYRMDGNFPVSDHDPARFLTSNANAVLLTTITDNNTTQYTDNLDVDKNGRTVTYYLVAYDAKDNASRIQGVMVEVIPSRVVNFRKHIEETTVTLEWDAISDPNADGLNVYRCDGTYDETQLKKLNINPIPTSETSFVDGAGNTNRVSETEVSYPQQGGTYYYVIEVIDSVTDWDTGTSNTSSTTTANYVAEKVDD